MAKLSKKQINEINSLCFISEVIKDKYFGNIAGTHWLDTPPDMWSKEESLVFDMLCELDNKLKAEFIRIASGK